jgi:nucleoside-diphosphate-sugar epimerase
VKIVRHFTKGVYMANQKKALVCGTGGFIGGHLVKRLKEEGYFVRGVDIKQHEYRASPANEFIQGDLREQTFCRKTTSDIKFDELYQLASDMGGAGYIFTGDHDAVVMHNSATINLNMAEEAKKTGIGKVFYSSSACICKYTGRSK